MQTITDSDRLRDVLAEIRRTGYHVGIRDLDNDALGVAAPIFDHDAQIAGAISVGAPVSRTSEQEIGRFLHLVRNAATEVSRQLGHHLPETAIGAVAADD
jgi:DNA-binding IclR family transcriptional regulator